MKTKILSLLILTALSSSVLAATPPDTLVVVQSLDDIVSLIRQKVMNCRVFKPYPASTSV